MTVEWECRECGTIRTWDMWKTAAEAYVSIECAECGCETAHVKMGGEDDRIPEGENER